MSVLVKSVSWSRTGGFAASLNTAQNVRFRSDAGGRISYYGGSGRYQQVSYFFAGGSQEQSLTVSGATKILPVWVSPENYYAYRSSSGLFLNSRNISNASYVHTIFAKTIQTDIFGWDTQVGSANATARIVYSAVEDSNSILVVKKLDFFGEPLVEAANYNAQINGDVSLSQNGLFCGVYRTTSPANKIRIFERQASSLVQKGLEITLPQTVKGLKINDAGNRFVAVTSTKFFTFDFIDGAWTAISEITISAGTSFSDGVVQMNAAGDIVIIRSDVILTFVFNNGAWVAQESIAGTGFGELAATKNFTEIAFNIFSGISSSFEIYQSTINEVTYDAPVITHGQSFTLAENNAFSGALAMLQDGLNRTVTSWSATGLPSGLSINATTGQITGTPTATGQFTASITATNPDGSDTKTVQFVVQVTLPIFAGAIRATAIYAGAAAAKALYYGAKKLWPPPQHHEILDSLATINPADGSRGHSKFLDTGLNLAVSNLTRIGFKFAGGVRIKNATITTTAATYTLGVATNWTLVKYFTSHDLTITTDGIGRSGSGDLGNGWGADVCGFWVDIPASSLTSADKITVDYEYIGAYAAKHGVAFWNATTTAGGTVESYMGTWDNNPAFLMPTTSELPRIVVIAQASLLSNTLCRRRVIIQNNP